jgi:two-component system, OmpR family, response regulator
MRLLVIEDDKCVCWLLQQGLQTQYAVETAENGQDGLFRATQTDFDAILLDLSLPDISGAQICRELREAGRTMPILVLTGETDCSSIASLLDIGADDYLTKPFRFEELTARLRAIIRRAQTGTNLSLLTAGDLELDSTRHTVHREGRLINLRRKEFDLLEYFMRNQARTLTRAIILEHVWDAGDELWGNVVDVHVKHLRDSIDRPFAEPLIQTVRGVGYKLEASAARAAERDVATAVN